MCIYLFAHHRTGGDGVSIKLSPVHFYKLWLQKDALQFSDVKISLIYLGLSGHTLLFHCRLPRLLAKRGKRMAIGRIQPVFPN